MLKYSNMSDIAKSDEFCIGEYAVGEVSTKRIFFSKIDNIKALNVDIVTIANPLIFRLIICF